MISELAVKFNKKCLLLSWFMAGFMWPLECLKKSHSNLKPQWQGSTASLETFFMLYNSRLTFYSYELLTFMRSLAKHNFPNMSHPDDNYCEKQNIVFSSEKQDAGSWGNRRGVVEEWGENMHNLCEPSTFTQFICHSSLNSEKQQVGFHNWNNFQLLHNGEGTEYNFCPKALAVWRKSKRQANLLKCWFILCSPFSSKKLAKSPVALCLKGFYLAESGRQLSGKQHLF